MSPIRQQIEDLLDAASLLFGEYRRRVLALLLLRPEESRHVRDMARALGKPPGTLLRELNALAEAGVLQRRRVGNQVHFQANGASPIYEDLRNILKKTIGIADVLRAALAPLAAQIRAAFVYGSVAQGRERAGSDVDLILVGDLGFADIVKLLHPAQETLGREISPRVYTVKEWKQKRRSPDAFLRDVLAKPKIFAVGSERELG